MNKGKAKKELEEGMLTKIEEKLSDGHEGINEGLLLLDFFVDLQQDNEQLTAPFQQEKVRLVDICHYRTPKTGDNGLKYCWKVLAKGGKFQRDEKCDRIEAISSGKDGRDEGEQKWLKVFDQEMADMMAWLQLFYTNVLMPNSAPTRRKSVIKFNLFAYIQSIDESHRQNEQIRDDWCQLRKEMAKVIDSLDTKIIDSVFENQMNSWLSILYLFKKEIKSEQYTVLNREWSMVNINENNKKGMIDEMGHDWEKAQKLIRDDLTQMHFANLEKFIETRMDFRQTFQEMSGVQLVHRLNAILGGDDPSKAVKLIRKCRQIEGVTKWFLAVHKPQFEQCFNTFNDNYQDSKAVSLSRSYEQLLLDADLFKNQFEFAHAFYSKPIVVDALLWLFSTLVDDLLMFVDGMFGLESGGYELTQKQNFGLLHTRTIYTLMKRSKRLSNFFCFHAENIAYAKDRLLMLVNSTANLDWLEMKFPEILKIGVINSRHRIFLYQSILSNRSESRIAQRSKARIVVPFLFEELNTRYQFCFDYEDPSKMQINDDVVNPMWDQFWLSIYPEMDTMKGICLAMFMLQFVDGLAESIAASPPDQQIEDCIEQRARLKQFQRYWELVEQKHLDFLLNGILSGSTILKLFPEGEFPDGTRPRLNKLLGTKLFTAFWHQFGDDIIDKQLFVNDIKLMDNYLCRNLGIEKKLRQEWVGMEKRALKENLRWMASDARGNAVMPKWIMKLHAKTLQKLAFGSAEKGNENGNRTPKTGDNGLKYCWKVLAKGGKFQRDEKCDRIEAISSGKDGRDEGEQKWLKVFHQEMADMMAWLQLFYTNVLMSNSAPTRRKTMNSWLSILYLLKKEIKSEQYTVLNREWSMVNINENNKKGMIDEMGHDWEKAQKLIRDDLTQMHYANLEKFIETRMDFRQTFQDSKAVSLSRSYEQLLLDADLFKNQFEFAHAFYSKPIVVDALLWLFSTLVDDLLMFVDGMFGLESGGYELTQKQNFGLLHTRTIYTLMKRSKRLSNFFCFHAENIAYAKDRLLMLVNSTANLDWLEMKFPEILKIVICLQNQV
uniref:Uncharacterized protein n=1 Tax=Globodera pallida TaxID=36090 RepID=A0A183BS75_GLOPA